MMSDTSFVIAVQDAGVTQHFSQNKWSEGRKVASLDPLKVTFMINYLISGPDKTKLPSISSHFRTQRL